MAEAVERKIASIINETPTAEEAEILGLVDVAPEGIPSVFSNISNDPFERQEYWRAVERSERTPKTHEIILDPEASPAWRSEEHTSELQSLMRNSYAAYCLTKNNTRYRVNK